MRVTDTLPVLALAFWLFFFLVYVPTYARPPSGGPSCSGSRYNPSYIQFLTDDMSKYFSFSLVRSRKEPFNPEDHYVFGYHPHGIIPLGLGWTTSSRPWAKLFPGILPASLSSTITHNVPIMRDILQLAGGYDVSRKGFIKAFNDRSSVALVPGGQSEMLMSRSYDKKVQLNCKHKVGRTT